MHQLERQLLELLAEPSRHSAHFDDILSRLDADFGDVARMINRARQHGFVVGGTGGYTDPADLGITRSPTKAEPRWNGGNPTIRWQSR